MNKTFPTLYKQSPKSGKVQQWTIQAVFNVMRVTHGKVGGKLQTNDKIIKGKNIGRANETSDCIQCVRECASRWTAQFDNGYVSTPDGVCKDVRPMLANTYNPDKKMDWKDWWVQKKLNGVRCIALKKDGKVEIRSRKGKSYNGAMRHLVGPLNDVLNEGDFIDGELYRHGWTLQQINRAVKKWRPDTSHKIQFHMFDYVIDGDVKMPYELRAHELWHITYSRILSKKLFKYVSAWCIDDKNDLDKTLDGFIADGYEGVILRNKYGSYLYGPSRSHDLLKYKLFHDKEVEIIDIREGVGTYTGLAVFICRDEFGNVFESNLKAPHARKRHIYKNRKKYIGKQLTISYQELSENNVPLINVGLEIRDYE